MAPPIATRDLNDCAPLCLEAIDRIIDAFPVGCVHLPQPRNQRHETWSQHSAQGTLFSHGPIAFTRVTFSYDHTLIAFSGGFIRELRRRARYIAVVLCAYSYGCWP